MKPSFVILGARGTMPVAGRRFLKYGGRTTCFCLKTGKGNIIIDAGTGITLLAEHGAEELSPATLFFTHFHIDHIVALPFLKRLYNSKSSLRLMADGSRKENWRSAVQALVNPPFWPVRLKDMRARIQFEDLPARRKGFQLYGVLVSWCPVFHPQGCLAYRFDTANLSVAVVTDHECGDEGRENNLRSFCENVDYLIYDAQFLPSELEAHRGWGHSTWEQGVCLAQSAGARELILTHHDHERRDDAVDQIVKSARRRFPKTRAARERMVLF